MLNALNIMNAFVNHVLAVNSTSSTSSTFSSVAGKKEHSTTATTTATTRASGNSNGNAISFHSPTNPSSSTHPEPSVWQWVHRAKLTTEEMSALDPLIFRVLNALLLASYEVTLEQRALQIIAKIMDMVLTGFRRQLLLSDFGCGPSPGPSAAGSTARANASVQGLPEGLDDNDDDDPIIINVAMRAMEEGVFQWFQGSDVEAAEERMTRAHWLLQTWLNTARQGEKDSCGDGRDVARGEASLTASSSRDMTTEGGTLRTQGSQMVYDAVVASLVRQCIARCGADTIGERVGASRVLQALMQLLSPQWLSSSSSSSSSGIGSSHFTPIPRTGLHSIPGPSPCLAVACVSSFVCQALEWPTESMPDYGVDDILGTVRIALAAAVCPFTVAYKLAATAAAVAGGGKEKHKITSKEGIKVGSKTGIQEEKVDNKTTSTLSPKGKRPRSDMTADSAAPSSSSKKDEKDVMSSRHTTDATSTHTNDDDDNNGDTILRQVLEHDCPELLSLIRSLASALFHPGPWVRLGARYALRDLAQHYARVRDEVKTVHMGVSDSTTPSTSSSSSSSSSTASSSSPLGPLSSELRELLLLVKPHLVVTSPTSPHTLIPLSQCCHPHTLITT